jgi:pimeloyl-ACP methyl ester carboxylesterase
MKVPHQALLSVTNLRTFAGIVYSATGSGNKIENISTIVKRFFLMNRDYSDFCDRGATWKEEYVSLPTGVELLSVVFTPPEPVAGPVILFIPGFVSLIDNFRGTLVELTRTHTVIYVETREKSTARISQDHRFSVDDITSDVVHFAELRIPEGLHFVMAGWSLGATAIAEAFPRLVRKPGAVLLIEPNSSFPFNNLALFFARLAKFIYRPVVPFVKWYMRTFLIDIKTDEEMYLINCRNLDTAEPARLGMAVRELSRYRMAGSLEQISVPALVVVTSKDRFHSHGEGTEIAARIPGAQCLDMEDNKRTHSAEMGRVISDFISSQAGKQAPSGQPYQEISLSSSLLS